MTEAEPEFAVVTTERPEALRCAGEVGDFRGREERENAKLDVFGEICEGDY